MSNTNRFCQSFVSEELSGHLAFAVRCGVLAREIFPPVRVAAAMKKKLRNLLKNPLNIFFFKRRNVSGSLCLLMNMFCVKAPRVRRKQQKNNFDYCWGNVFEISSTVDGESVCLCVRHYEQQKRLAKSFCCFPKKSGESCSGRLTTCPQRLIPVLKNIAGATNLFCDNICQKHLSAADKDERVLCDKNYVAPRKVRILYSAICNNA